jgi:hypothetical protein
MAQPQWITPAGSLGVIPEGIFYQQNLQAIDPSGGDIFYIVIAGELPAGIQLNTNGQIIGIPSAVARLQGVPFPVSEDVTSKFTVRAYTNASPPRISDRTFTLTVSGDDPPEFITPPGSLGSFFDSDFINIQIAYTDTDPGDTVVVRFVAGELPGGVRISNTGLISGYIRPAANINKPTGYDLTPVNTEPYDFIVKAVNKNYQFTLEVTDGKSSSLRTFEFFVFDRDSLTAGTGAWYLRDGQFWNELTPPLVPFFNEPGWATADSGLTTDVTPTRKPFLVNASPSNLGTIRGDNRFAYQFIGNDYDTPDLKYAISIDRGVELPPGLVLDPESGWLYGEIPPQGVTEVEYSFNISVYEAEFVGTPIACTGTIAGGQNRFLNRIVCASTAQLGARQPIVFTGTSILGITASPTTIYYVLTVFSETEFSVSTRPGGPPVVLATTTGLDLLANLVVASDLFPFSLTVSGDIDAEVTWLTPADLGIINNGDVSLFKVEAVNRGGQRLEYRLREGAFNELPQGLELLPTGEIVGRVSFNTFSIDLGRTTFDQRTTWDSKFTFTVNAYSADDDQDLFEVSEVLVIDGGSGYDEQSPPIIEFSDPTSGTSARRAEAGDIIIEDGSIQSVAVADPGAGYLEPATISVIGGGTGAELTAVMRKTGIQDAVSVFKTFSIMVNRANNKPYQSLSIQALPSEDSRQLIASLLENDDIFVPEFIFRPDDPNFGKATNVIYDHAFGLNPETLDLYVESLEKNHYWKNLILGNIQTAQAVDQNGNVIYEVVYSRIFGGLTNSQDQSVGKIVNLPYAVVDPVTGNITTQVFPNSLINMRNQVIDVVGQQSTLLPGWMTSRQPNGRVLGFTPAWVMCYTVPGKSEQIAYYLNNLFGEKLNLIDFKVDRYILDRTLSKNWNTETQSVSPAAVLTTFDRFNTGDNTFIGTVSLATELAYSDVNNRSLSYINSLGGIDGIVTNINNNTIIFVRQENFLNYPDVNEAWQDYIEPFDTVNFDPLPRSESLNFEPGSFDYAELVSGERSIFCTGTDQSTNTITCGSTANLRLGDIIWFVGDTTGSGLLEIIDNPDAFYYVIEIVSATEFKVSSSADSVVPVSLTTQSFEIIAYFGNDRMAIYRISVDPVTEFVTLTLEQQTAATQFVQVQRGRFFRSAELQYPISPVGDLTRVNWVALNTEESESGETFFDQGSVSFVEPVDMYDPSNAEDKYLVFPKTNILE